MFGSFKRLFRPSQQPPVRPSGNSPRRRVRGNGLSALFGTVAGGGYLEALRTTGDRTSVAVAFPGAVVGGYERVALSMLARAVYDNGGLAAYAVDQIALYSAPVLAQSACPDSGWRDAAEAFWRDWQRNCDFAGRQEMDFAAIQGALSVAMDLDGDVAVVVTDEGGFPQLQIVDGYRIRSGPTDENAIDGAVLDSKGRVLGYSVLSPDGKTTTTIPTSQVFLLRDPSVVHPYRGLSPLRRGMNDLRDARDILGFEKLAVKHNASLIGLIEGGEITETSGFSLGPSVEGEVQPGVGTVPIAEEDATEGEKALSRQDMLGGDIPVLDPGQKFTRVEGNRPNAQFDTFLDTLVAQFVAGLGLPPAFFLDSRLTGPNARGVNAKAQRRFDRRQEALGRLTRWVWARVIAWAIAKGILPPADGWAEVTLQFPAKFSIDAGREAQADRDDHARGLLTRQDHFGARGKDWKGETDQLFEEDAYIIERAKEMADKFGLPVEVILTRWGFAQTGGGGQQNPEGGKPGEKPGAKPGAKPGEPEDKKETENEDDPAPGD